MNRHLLLAEFARQPWALTPDYLALAASVLTRWSFGIQPGAETLAKIEADKQARAARSEGQQAGTIAVIPVYGILTQRPPQDISGPGGTSTASLCRAIEAAADSNIRTIVCEFDTPGGSVYGMSELAETIYQARQKKPVIGIANSLSASAGYCAMSQCSEIFCTPSGEVGSIGVYTAHQYIGAALEKEGIVTTLISEGMYKVEGNPFEALNEEAKAAIQARVADYFDQFVEAVARGRGTTIAKVKGGMGQGRVLGAKEALAEGMIDGIKTFDALLASLQADSPAPKSAGRNRRAMAAMELDLIEA